MIPKEENKPKAGRPYLGIYFRCCRIYYRIYKNRSGTAYEGCCPRCRRRISIKIGAGGTTERFFVAQ